MADVAEIKQTQTPGMPGDANVLNIKEPGIDTSKFEKASAKAYKDSITNWDFYVKNEWKKQSADAVKEFGNNPAQLQQALEKIRTDGYAISRGDYVADAIGIGAPVFNAEGELACSIGIITPEIRLSDENSLDTLSGYVKSFAGELSADLGYLPHLNIIPK